ncbi:MAG: type II toxin-antitoxin system RelE/ParE family toxin [Cyanothece sp. SIO2G6]|nr:type II toxin-antitoxin system RelE/ParE family toxin [Cyanothece sp. SIO2G6]
MRVRFKPSFKRDLKKIKDTQVLVAIEVLLNTVKSAERPDVISNLIKMKGYDNFYRVRISNYRVGIQVIEDDVIFVRVLHRREIYRYFP